MEVFKKVVVLWQKLRKNWRIKYRLIIHNDNTNRDSFTLRLSPRNIFVVVTTSAFFLIILTAMLIAFTPLRVYVPGYTDPDEYRQYKKAAARVDSVENILRQNQQYMDNFYRILNNEIMPDELTENKSCNTATPSKEINSPSQAEIELRQNADDLLTAIEQHQSNEEKSISRNANRPHLQLLPPTIGIVSDYYSIPQKKYGINICNHYKTLITSSADGIIVYAGYDVHNGNTIIIQHLDNVITVYKHNYTLFKTTGAKVVAGEPIAEMGNSGIGDKTSHLYFEIWHNGFPVNPLDYLTIE